MVTLERPIVSPWAALASTMVVEFRDRDWSGSIETVGTWRVITCQVMGASWTRGGSQHRGLLNVPEVTQASLQLIDPSRLLDPGNEAGTWYGQIDVGSDLRLTFAGRVVFMGRITTIEHALNPDPDIIMCHIGAIEHLGRLAQLDLGALPGSANIIWPEEQSGARVIRILDLAGAALGPGERDIHTGGIWMWDKPQHQFGIAFDELLATMRAEIGSLEVTPAGAVRTRSRNTVWPVTPPAHTLNLGCHAGAIPIHELEFAWLRDTVRNHVNMFVDGWAGQGEGETVTLDTPAEDRASQARYGLRTYFEPAAVIFQGLAHPEIGPWKTFFLARMKSPMQSWRVTLRPQSQAEVDAIENTPLYTGWARVTAENSGPYIDEKLRLVGAEWSVDPDGQMVILTLGWP